MDFSRPKVIALDFLPVPLMIPADGEAKPESEPGL